MAAWGAKIQENREWYMSWEGITLENKITKKGENYGNDLNRQKIALKELLKTAKE